jgi:LPXTG-motif cell wall-anchored protein
VRNRIFGGIGVIWGALIIYGGLSSPASEAGSAAYKNGQTGALVFGAVLLGLGLYYFFKKPKPNV